MAPGGFPAKHAALLACATLLLGAPDICGGGSALADVSSRTSPDDARKALFTINGTPVDSRELLTFIEIMSGGDSPAAGLPEMVDTLINNRLMAGAAVRDGVDQQPRVRSRIETRANKLWNQLYLEQLAASTSPVTDREMLEAAPPFEEMISVQQLIVDTPEKAERLRLQAVQGESFDNLVLRNTIGLTRKNDGKIGYVKRTSTIYEPETIESIFPLAVGEYSAVLPTRLGYSVFRILDRKSAETQKTEWLASNRERFNREKTKKKLDENRSRLAAGHAVVVDQRLISEYLKARAENSDPGPLLQKSVIKIDDVEFFLGDMLDPADIGFIHSESSLEIILNKRVEDFAVSREVDRLGLKNARPELLLREKLLRESVYAREYVNYRCREIEVTRAETREYYEKNGAAFTLPRALDISLIETKSEARLERIYDLLAGGTSFEEVAESWSDNKSIKGGRLGFVPEQSIAPEFSAVKKIGAGTYSKTPIRIKAGGESPELFVVAKVNSVREPEPLPFERVAKDDIEKAIMAGKRERVVRTILEELRKSNEVRFTPEYERFAVSSANRR